MNSFAIVDISNLFSRARHAIRGDVFERAGIALSICFRSLRKMHRDYGINHVVVCTDSSPSWRHAVYPAYKRKRRLLKAGLTKREQEENEVFFAVLNDLIGFLHEQTRCTVLTVPGCEADDLVAGWVQAHPNDQHFILSGDSDFVQLLAPNVRLLVHDANGNRVVSLDGVVDDEGHRLAFSLDNSTGRVRPGVPDDQFTPESDWWKKSLFIKIIRGDSGDGVFSAYPGVRFEGSVKRVGIQQAWDDRASKGYHWNNFMQQEWDKVLEDGTKLRVRVSDEFKINEHLIDLTKQPLEIRSAMENAIASAATKASVSNVGIHFLKFCGRQDLPALAKEMDGHLGYLNSSYPRAA